MRGLRMAELLTAAALSCAAALPAAADEPLPMPETHSVCAAGGAYCAVADVIAEETRVMAGDTVLWTVPGWHRDIHLSADGADLVIGYDGLDLLVDTDKRPETVMLSFWHQGAPVRDVTLSEIVADLDNLQGTVSHYLWGYIRGFDPAGLLVVQTIESRMLTFDPATGTIVANVERPY
ncbi:MAG: hypothetical protein R3F55_03350 [Alphaproteobacteria bacterium]